MAEMRQGFGSVRWRAVATVAVALALVGCSSGVDGASSATTQAKSASGATTTSSATTIADGASTSSSAPDAEASTTTADSGEQSEDTRPSVAGDSTTYAVVRVADDDLLNVREQPGPDAEVFGGFIPFHLGVELTGEEADVGDQHWVKVNGGVGTDLDGWVNDHFLVPIQGDTDQTFWFYRDASIFRELLSSSPDPGRLGEQIEVTDPKGEIVVSADGHFDDDDQVLSVADLAGAGTSADSERTWGSDAGTGEPITATIERFFADFGDDPSLAETDAVAIDERIHFGNTIDNAAEFFPDGVVVELHYAGDDGNEDLTWRTTRMVIKKIDEADEAGPGPPGVTPEQNWQLVGVAFDSWTI